MSQLWGLVQSQGVILNNPFAYFGPRLEGGSISPSSEPAPANTIPDLRSCWTSADTEVCACLRTDGVEAIALTGIVYSHTEAEGLP